ncbi:MAG: hypothetical protein M3548_04745 [Actinomycetota bacterium]|nr:hypothetical protein [Actinomycetota bacterium]
MTTNRVCASCGAADLEAGFVMDSGQNARGYTSWVAGALERGMFGGAKLFGKQKWAIEAHRCPRCHFLNMFANEEI